MRLAALASFAVFALFSSIAPSRADVPSGERIRERLRAEGPQRILVRFETAVDDAIAVGTQTVAHRACEATNGGIPCAISIARHYGRVKQRALCGLEGVVLTQDYQYVPMSFVRVDTETGLDGLLARPEIALVYDDVDPAQLGFLAFVRDPPSFSCAFASGRPDGVWLWGDWNGDGSEDVGKYVPALDAFLLDADGDGLWRGVAGGDRVVMVASAAGAGQPLVGDWNGDGADGVGKRTNTSVLLDANENGRWDGHTGGDRNTRFAPAKTSVMSLVADWNGDGRDDYGVYWLEGYFLLDRDGDGRWDGEAGGDRLVRNPLPCGTEPIAVDWDADRPGASVGIVQGRGLLGSGYALDLDEDGRLNITSAEDLVLQPESHCLAVPLADD